MPLTDEQQLIEFGFPRDRVQYALKVTNNGGLQQAMDWYKRSLLLSLFRLLAHADEPLPATDQDLIDIGQHDNSKQAVFNPYQDEDKGKASVNDGVDFGKVDDAPKEEKQPQPSCLKCNECNKKFSNVDLAQLHATKTGHSDFGESMEGTIMSAEERRAHLETLRERLKSKKEQEARQAIELAKSNELLRRKAGRDLSEFKEELEEKQVKKALEEQKRAKLEEKAAKTKILAQIEEDRRLKRERVGHAILIL